MSEIEPLQDDIFALVAAAKNVPDLTGASKAAILEATLSKIGPLPPSGGGGGAATGSGGSAAAGIGTKTVAALVATFAIGIVVGIAVDRSIARAPDGGATPAVASSIARTATMPADLPPHVAVVDTVSPASLPDAPRLVPSASAARVVPSAESPSSRGLAAERALLDVARSALARGEAGEALTAATRHSREYPDGALVEEREALAVKALVALGRKDEARTRVRALEQRFPTGLSVRAAKAAVEGAP